MQKYNIGLSFNTKDLVRKFVLRGVHAFSRMSVAEHFLEKIIATSLEVSTVKHDRLKRIIHFAKIRKARCTQN